MLALYPGQHMREQRKHYHPRADRDLPDGYVIAQPTDSSYGSSAGIAVPANALDVLNDDAARRAQEAQLAREAAREPAGSNDVAPDVPSGSSLRKPESPPPAAADRSPQRSAPHFVDPAPFERAWRKPAGRHWVRCWSPADLLQQVNRHNDATGYSDRDSRARMAAIYKQLHSGPWRRCNTPSNHQLTMSELSLECPQMEEAIRLVSDQLGLARSSAAPVRLMPLLLVGRPGVGKTHFALRLAEILSVPCRIIDFTAQQTNSVLHGDDRHWSNSKAGMLFDSVVLGSCANPVIVLDEIDKSSAGGGRSYDPLAPLHLALEPTTARRTLDLSTEIEFDASWVTYIATANSLKGIPASLLSRMTIILCQEPTPRQAFETTQAVVKRFLSSSAASGIDGVTREAVRELALHTPRDAARLLQIALGRLTSAGRRVIEVEDIQSNAKTPHLH